MRALGLAFNFARFRVIEALAVVLCMAVWAGTFSVASSIVYDGRRSPPQTASTAAERSSPASPHASPNDGADGAVSGRGRTSLRTGEAALVAAAAISAAAFFALMSGRMRRLSGDYGVVRALGASALTIFRMILVECSIFALSGLLLSPCVAIPILHAIETTPVARSRPFHPAGLELAAFAAVAGVLMVLAVALQAWQASRIDIPEALADR